MIFNRSHFFLLSFLMFYPMLSCNIQQGHCIVSVYSVSESLHCCTFVFTTRAVVYVYILWRIVFGGAQLPFFSFSKRATVVLFMQACMSFVFDKLAFSVLRCCISKDRNVRSLPHFRTVCERRKPLFKLHSVVNEWQLTAECQPCVLRVLYWTACDSEYISCHGYLATVYNGIQAYSLSAFVVTVKKSYACCTACRVTVS